MQRLFIFIVLVIMGMQNVFADTRVIRHNAVTSETEELLFGILKLAVAEIDPNIAFESLSEFVPQSRAEADVIDGGLSLVWGSSTPAREETLKAVRIPVLKGLLGHRVFLIHPADQHKFDNVHTLQDLKKLTAGQGIDWGDAAVLRTADIPMVTANKYESLFHMIEGGRFDYFPRAVHEPWEEMKRFKDLELAVEKNLLLVYPMTMHFYVAPNNPALHDLIYKGLELAMQNGNYDKFFLNHPLVRDALEKSNVKGRRVIRIANPHIPPDTPIDRQEFWLSLF